MDAEPWNNDETVAVLDEPWNADPEATTDNPWDNDPPADPALDQSPVETFGQSFVRGLSNVVPSIVGGASKVLDKATDIAADLTGTQKGGLFQDVAGFTDEITAESQQVYPVSDANPIAATLGVGAAQGLSLLAGGAVAKGLGVANASTVPLAAGFSMGAGSGIDKAQDIGVESPEAQLAMGLLFGGVELATERLGGIGNKAATDALLNAYKQPAADLLARAAKTVAGEGGEEMLAGTAQDLLTRAFATEDPANPGFTRTGVKLPDLDRQFLRDRGLDFVGGASGGAVFAGADALMNRNRPTGPEPMASELNPTEVTPPPNPFAGPIQPPPQPTEDGGVTPPPFSPPSQPRPKPAPPVPPPTASDLPPFDPVPNAVKLSGVRAAHPLSGYLGNKATMLDAGAYDDIIPRDQPYERIVEAFAGSGMLGNRLAQVVPHQRRAINDFDPNVVNFHQRVVEDPDAVAAKVNEIADAFDRFKFLAEDTREAKIAARERVRALWKERIVTDSTDAVEQAGRFFVRNNGVLGVMGKNQRIVAEDIKSGRFKWGITPDWRARMQTELRSHARELGQVEITNGDARQVLQNAAAGDLVTVDPPYVAETAGKKVADYDKGKDLTSIDGAVQFIEQDVGAAVSRGAHILYTNYARPEIVEALRRIGLQTKIVERRSQRGNKLEVVGYNTAAPRSVEGSNAVGDAGLSGGPPVGRGSAAAVSGRGGDGTAAEASAAVDGGLRSRGGVVEYSQPWDNDPTVEDVSSSITSSSVRDAGPAVDVAGTDLDNVLQAGEARVEENTNGEITVEIPQAQIQEGQDVSQETADWLQSWFFGRAGKPGDVYDVPSDNVLRELAAFKPSEPIELYRSHRIDAPRDQFESWTTDQKFARLINTSGRKILKETISPDRIVFQLSRLPAQFNEIIEDLPDEIVVVNGDAIRRVKRAEQRTPADTGVEALSAKYAVPAARGPLTTLHYAQLPPTATGRVWSGQIRTLHGIRNKLLTAAGLPQVGIGRFARALGIYRVKPETIRLQAINDIPVLSHELGHAIHYRELSANRTKADNWGGRFDPELMALGQATSTPTYTPDQVRKEGVAEFTRLWLTDTAQARAAAPRFSAFWEAELDRRNPKLAQGLRDAREEIADYIAMPAFQKAKAQISFDPTSEKVPRTLGARLRAEYAKWVNTLQPALDVVRQTAIVDPNQAVRAKEVEAWMENHRGGWASKAHADIFGNQTTLDGKRLGPGMAQILKEIGPNQAESFSTYLALKRAAEIERQGKRSGFENARLPAAEMKTLEARFETTRQKLLKWSNNELQLLVDSGLLDGQAGAKMQQLNQDYVPFYRIYEKLNGVSFGPEGGKNSGGYVDLNSGIRRLKGSDRAIVDPLQSLMKNAFMFRKIAEQNHIGVQFFDLLSDVQGHGKWTEQVRPKQKATIINHAQMVQKLIDEDVIQSEADLPQDADLTLRLFEAIKRPDTAKGEVIVFKNGQRQHWEVKDPVLMEALKNSDGDSIKLWKFLGGTLGKAVTLPTRIVRFGATGGPWFALPNFVRDQVIAGVQSRTGFIPFVDGIRGAFEVMRKGDMYQRWIEAGGKFHGITTGTQAFTDLLADALPKEPSARAAMARLADPRNWKRALGYAGEVMEEATRVQEFARGVRQGLPERQAANLSKTVSLNFARAGERGRALNQIIAFTNAKIQDLDLIVRSHLDPARRGQVMAKGFLYITVPSILTWWLGKDDEEIQNLPEWRKNMFWNINMAPVSRVLGRESFILSIPKPFLMGAIYGTSVERALDYATDRDPNGMRKAMKNLFANGPDGLNPVEMAMSVAGIKPLIEATTNYNLFQDRAIVPESMKFLPKEQQYDIHTSETAKMVGKFTGQSPMIVDHLMRGYFATAGKFGTDAIDYGLAKLGAADVPPAPAKDIMEAPILNRFSGSPYAANVFVDRFYKATQEMEGKLAVWNKQTEQMTEPAQKAWWEKNGKELQHYLRTVNYDTGLTGAGQIRKAMAAMSDMNKAMKDAQASRVLSPEEKRQRMMRLSLMRNEVAENAFKQLFPEPVRKRHY